MKFGPPVRKPNFSRIPRLLVIFRYFRISRQKGGVEQKKSRKHPLKTVGACVPQKERSYAISIKLTQNEHSGKEVENNVIEQLKVHYVVFSVLSIHHPSGRTTSWGSGLVVPHQTVKGRRSSFDLRAPLKTRHFL